MWSCLSNISLYKFNAFFVLTKHLGTVAPIFAVWDVTERPAWISYSFFAISQIEEQHMFFFFFPLSQDCSPFHLKEELYSFSLADQNCQNHYSCVLGPLLSKIRVIEHQHWGPMAVDLIVEMAANEWDVLDKEAIHIQGGTKQDFVRFNHITQVGLWGLLWLLRW